MVHTNWWTTSYCIYSSRHIKVNTQTTATDSKKLPTIKMLLLILFNHTKN